jgi:hypothetical protein
MACRKRGTIILAADANQLQSRNCENAIIKQGDSVLKKLL